eukprot:GFYU01008037.1.p1 GENE.GFYU01008037.1~~GFYU01008037.1.p1  ORF type:complete len:577 (+),score=90.99 GFYU01008037.1:57-1787(+)
MHSDPDVVQVVQAIQARAEGGNSGGTTTENVVKVTVGDVVEKTGFHVEDATYILLHLCSSCGGSVNTHTTATGVVPVYVFPLPASSLLAQLKSQERVSAVKAFWRSRVVPWFWIILRASFGVALVLSLSIVMLALAVIMIAMASQGQRGDRGRGRDIIGGGHTPFFPGGGGGGGFNLFGGRGLSFWDMLMIRQLLRDARGHREGHWYAGGTRQYRPLVQRGDSGGRGSVSCGPSSSQPRRVVDGRLLRSNDPAADPDSTSRRHPGEPYDSDSSTSSDDGGDGDVIGSGTGNGRGRRRGRSGDVSFLESVFSFLFGDRDPNRHIERHRWRMVAAVVRVNGGVIAEEQILPFLDLPHNVTPDTASSLSVASSYRSHMYDVIAKFQGCPEASDEGTLVYRFPALQHTSDEGLARTLCTAVAQQKQSYTSLQYDTNLHFKERLHRFSKNTSQNPLYLGIANLVVVLIFNRFRTAGVIEKYIHTMPRLHAGVVSLVNLMFYPLLAYALLYLMLPGLRYLWITYVVNPRITRRNERREQQGRALTALLEEIESSATLSEPAEKLRSKLSYMRRFAGVHMATV